MTLYDWLLFLHIVAATLWVGGTAILSALATYTVRGGDREEVRRFLEGLRVLGPIVFGPALIALVALGVWMVVDSGAWSFGQTWIWLALGLAAAAVVVGAAVQGRAAIGARKAAAAGDDGEAVRQLRRYALGGRLVFLLLLVAIWDMVFKPGL
jgi:uncharacterized membrane protein